jgi:FkbM family methyltransferase
MISSPGRYPAIGRAYARLKGVPVIGAFLRRTTRKLLSPDCHQWVHIAGGLAQGMSMLVDPRFELHYLRGDYEPWIQEWMEGALRRGHLYCDVGAHAGFFVLCAARLVGTGGAIFAFEPDPDNYLRLAAAVERNGLTHVQAFPAAAWSSSGTAGFHRASPDSGRFDGRVAGSPQQGSHLSTVTTIQLDDILGDPPRAVKIDVEGGESEVLKGAARIASCRATQWLVELHGTPQETEVQAFFCQHGYSVHVAPMMHPADAAYTRRCLVATP